MTLASESIDPVFPEGAYARLEPRQRPYHAGREAREPAPPPREPAAPRPEPGARELVTGLLRALAGLGLLGAAAGLGSVGEVSHTAGWAVTLRMVPATVLNIGGALLLASPALVALHQFLDLRARPEALAAALTRGLIAVGQLAAGLAPVVLFFSATTDLWLAAFLASMLALGAVGYVVCARELTQAERGNDEQAPVSPRFHALVHGWLLLTLLIALRLGVDLADFVLAVSRF